MKTFRFKWMFTAIVTIIVVSVFSCNKTDVNPDNLAPNQSKISVYLTDGPGYFDSVLINLKSLAVKIDTTPNSWRDGDGHGRFHGWHHSWGNQDQKDDGAFWDTLQVNQGMVNLLNFANGADTLLATGIIPKGRILAFRLTLNNEGNYLVKDNVRYPLNLMPGWNNVYVRVYGDNFQPTNSDNYRMWIDFDASRSVVKVHSGEFYLKPFLRAFAEDNTGSVTGNVKPFEAYPVISVENETDTLYAIPGRGGKFMVKGLPEGTYNVFINASNGYSDTTIANISITAGKATNVGSVNLHK